MYFFFNESNQEESRTTILAGAARHKPGTGHR